MRAWTEIGRRGSAILIVADHASAYVPPEINLGIGPELLDSHIALDIGVADLAELLCGRLACNALLGAHSRLVADLNRHPDDPAVIPVSSDGVAIPGNVLTYGEREDRLAAYWQPYHDHLAELIAAQCPALIVSLHSFTPYLATAPDQARPWNVGILYNDDDRAPRIAIPMLEAAGVCVGDQQPYSGKLLNATMNRHAEANGIAYLGIEVRQDRITNPAGITQWCQVLAPVITACASMASRM